MTMSRYSRHLPVAPQFKAGCRATTLAEPSPLFGANGIRIAPDGKCWIAEFRGGTVSAWDADLGTIETVVPPGGVIGGPDDIAFGPDGTAYVTDYELGAVVAVRPGGEPQRIVADLPKVNGISVTNGCLYVTEYRPDGRLLAIDLAGGVAQPIAQLRYPNAFDFGPDGRAYVQDVMEGKVYSVGLSTRDVRLEFDGFEMPAAVKVDRAGRLIVVEFASGNIYRVDLGSRERELVTTLDPGVDNVDSDDAGRLYVSCGPLCRVVRLTDGEVDTHTGDGFVGPFGLALMNGSVAVADVLRVVAVSLRDMSQRTIWKQDARTPFHILDVAWAEGRLFAVTEVGEVRWLRAPGVAPIIFRPPADGLRAVAAAASGHRLVIGIDDGTIVELTLDGKHTATWRSGLAALDSVDVAPDGAVAASRAQGWISTSAREGGRRIWRCFDAPEAVARLNDGALLVTEANGSVHQLSADGERQIRLAEGLPFGLPGAEARSGRHSSLVTGPDASAIVGCDGDGALIRLHGVVARADAPSTLQ